MKNIWIKKKKEEEKHCEPKQLWARAFENNSNTVIKFGIKIVNIRLFVVSSLIRKYVFIKLYVQITK